MIKRPYSTIYKDLSVIIVVTSFGNEFNDLKDTAQKLPDGIHKLKLSIAMTTSMLKTVMHVKNKLITKLIIFC
jgi:hypothetical protein